MSGIFTGGRRGGWAVAPAGTPVAGFARARAGAQRPGAGSRASGARRRHLACALAARQATPACQELHITRAYCR